MLPGFKCGECDCCFGVAVTEQHGIYICCQQFGIICYALGNMETFRDGLRSTLRKITDNWHLKFTVQCGKIREMMYLRDCATPDNTYSYTTHKF